MVHLYFSNKKFKLVLFIVIALFFTSCNNLPKNRKWESIEVVRTERERLQVGDIIIKNKVFKRPMTWMGHSAMVVAIDTIGDYPRFFANYYEIDTYSWLYEDRDVIVLRYKYFDERFKEAFLRNVKKYGGKSYAISSKGSTTTFYCSKYVWKVYLETAKELGYKLDLDSDGGFLVLPFDIMRSQELDEVIF